MIDALYVGSSLALKARKFRLIAWPRLGLVDVANGPKGAEKHTSDG